MIELLALALILFGFALIVIGMLKGYEEKEFEKIAFEEEFEEEEERRKKKVKKDVKAGGVVLIGPIPIVFGESRYAVYALILTIILMVMSIILMLSLSL